MTDQIPAQSIELSLISHTNVGKTTLARTLLGHDVGTVLDAPHVTETADSFPMVETAQGDRLLLWDTPGFGDSARLARRLAQSDNPIGWLLSSVWDRFRDRAFWSSQQAVRNVGERADVVLYLVNAAEDPDDAGYVGPELRVLDWIGKPVIVLLNQLGPPRPHAETAAEIERWRARVAQAACVRAVLPLDAFARCWIQEGALLDALASVLGADRQAAFERMRTEWMRLRREAFDASMQVLARRVARAALDREPIASSAWTERLREAGAALGLVRAAADSPRQAAMRALAGRLDADIRNSTDELIRLHRLGGRATDEVLTRLARHYAVREPVSEGKAAMFGGLLTGALAGLKADLATGGLSFGAGLLAGGVIGALGAAGLARGYNIVRRAGTPSVIWADPVLDELFASALLGYLAVAHYGRGRGDWAPSEHPAHWQQAVQDVAGARAESLQLLWQQRDQDEAAARLPERLRTVLTGAALDALARLYPDAAAAAATSQSVPAGDGDT
ncbi:MAG: DUF3482 domain-containing protein [Burkholderiales bacterium]|nr:MAG: DUF3482 domain-containing protein [Burkholderiales bacterium]